LIGLLRGCYLAGLVGYPLKGDDDGVDLQLTRGAGGSDSMVAIEHVVIAT
jgi:hypothetical protein